MEEIYWNSNVSPYVLTEHCHSNLKSIVFGDSLNTIGERALYNCTKITSVNIPSKVSTIGDEAFSDCSGLISMDLSNISDIGKKAFYKCSNLRTVYLPSEMNEIGDEAFSGCGSLKTLVLPERIKRIGAKAFYDDHNHWEKITLPSTASEIGEYAFYYCWGFDTISIPDGVVKIGDGTFSLCLVNVLYIPSCVDTIGKRAFDCAELSEIHIQEGLKYIGDRAFADNYNFSTIVLPSTLTGMGEEVFSGCDNLKWIYCMQTTPPVVEHSLFSYDSDMYSWCTLYVPDGSEEAYKSDSIWQKFLHIETFDVTAVNNILPDTQVTDPAPEIYYDIQGRKMDADSLEELPRGLYIIGRKKFIIL